MSEPRHDSGGVRALTERDLRAVIDGDAGVFRGHRGAVLEWALGNAPAYAHMIPGERPQYCLGRQGRLFDQVGPIVAEDGTHARALVDAALAAAGGRAIVIDAFDAHADFISCLRARGFHAERPLMRMCRAGRRVETTPEASVRLVEYAILGPEFA